MKVGLKLNEQMIILMPNISNVMLFDKAFHINMMSEEAFVITRESDFNYTSVDDSAYYIPVKVNEYHRIQRELSEYLGITVEDLPMDENS